MFQHAIHKHVAAKLGLMQIIHKTIDKEGDGSSQKLINDGFMYMSAKTAKINYNNILDCTSIRHHLASQVPAHKGVSYDEDHRKTNNNNNNNTKGVKSHHTFYIFLVTKIFSFYT